MPRLLKRNSRELDYIGLAECGEKPPYHIDAKARRRDDPIKAIHSSQSRISQSERDSYVASTLENSVQRYGAPIEKYLEKHYRHEEFWRFPDGKHPASGQNGKR